MRRIFFGFMLVVIGGLWFIKGQKANAWGFFAHKKINRIAVFTLPSPLIGLYKKHIDFVEEHAIDPDKRRYAVEGEAVRHYIDLEHYYDSSSSVYDIPMGWDSAVSVYSEDSLLKNGILPWNLFFTYYGLVNAFKERDLEAILKKSADIGHYIGDATVPLHTTVNYNGQLTNQVGIHGFWESRVPELFSEDYDFFTGRAEAIDRVLPFFWELIYSSHQLVQPVLEIEKELSLSFDRSQQFTVETRGRQNVKTYSEKYAESYQTAMDGMVERQMREAIISVGSVWYSAWIQAGKPNVDSLISLELSAEQLQQIELYDQKISIKTIESRSHEH